MPTYYFQTGSFTPITRGGQRYEVAGMACVIHTVSPDYIYLTLLGSSYTFQLPNRSGDGLIPEGSPENAYRVVGTR